MTQKVYRGRLVRAGNGEEDDLLGLDISGEDAAETVLLAELLSDDMAEYGAYLTVRYFLTDGPVTRDALIENLAKMATGVGEIDYGMHYSEITGYLWTDEEIRVGGHDLLQELYDALGRFLHLEIEYQRAQP